MNCWPARNTHRRLNEDDAEEGMLPVQTDQHKILEGEYKVVKAMIPYLWPVGEPILRLRVVASLFFLVCSKVFSVLLPLIYKGCVDAVTGENDTNRVYNPVTLIILYGICRLCTRSFGDLRDAVFVKVSQHARRTAACETFVHLHSLSLAFHLKRETGAVLRAIERGTRGISTILSFFLFSIAPIFLELLFTLIVLLSLYAAWFAVVTFVTILLYVIVTLSITEWRNKFRRELNVADNSANNKAIDSLLNYETVKYFSNEEHERARYDSALIEYQDSAIKSATSLAVLNTSQSLIIAIGCTVVTLMAGHKVVQGEMTAGDFVLVNSYIIQLYTPLNFLGSSYRMIKQALVDMENMFQLLDVEQDVCDADDATELTVPEGRIEFDNVVFGYAEDEPPVLNGVSFTVEPGQTVAIVGPSGAGKSTIARLLFRFYDVSSGTILIDGQDITAVTQHSLRKSIGIVPQDTVLFNDGVGYNVKYGRVEATDDEMHDACKTAQVYEFIAGLPAGFDTVVGERGLRLSGGEKQRVSIARAVLKDTPICMFDEATSALDTKTERDLQEALDAVSQTRTTLVIAHRLSTVVAAHQILVLKDGVIAEAGTHADLYAHRGEYYEMWMQQQQEEAAAVGGGGVDDESGGDEDVVVGAGAGVATEATLKPANGGSGNDA